MRRLRFWNRITHFQLRRLVLLVEVLWVILILIIYYYFPIVFGFFPYVLVVNLMTILPLVRIIKKLKNSVTKEGLEYGAFGEVEKFKIGIWEKSCIGYFVIVNGLMLIFVISFMYDWIQFSR